MKKKRQFLKRKYHIKNEKKRQFLKRKYHIKNEKKATVS